MKSRVRKVVNFFAFNLLFFALYLNFIHKDKSSLPPVSIAAGQQKAQPAINSSIVEAKPQVNNSNEQRIAEKIISVKEETAPLKLSIN